MKSCDRLLVSHERLSNTGDKVVLGKIVGGTPGSNYAFKGEGWAHYEVFNVAWCGEAESTGYNYWIGCVFHHAFGTEVWV